MFRSADNSECGVVCAVGSNGWGITAYNNTCGTISPGDVVYLTYTGTAGMEVKANLPAASTPWTIIGVATESFAKETIGKIQVYGKAKCSILTTAIAIGDHVEVLPVKSYGGTITNLTLTKGSGSTRDTIVDGSSTRFVSDGFAVGHRIIISNATTAGNIITGEIYSVTTTTITLTTIGAFAATEAMISGATLKTQGYAVEDATSESANSFAVAMEADTTGDVDDLNVFLYGGIPIGRKTLAGS